MHVWKDKAGKKLTAKQFMARWKEGIEKVTPLQQIKAMLQGYLIIMLGELWGIYITLSLGQFWLSSILSGGFIVTKYQMTGTYQKKILLERLNQQMKGGIK